MAKLYFHYSTMNAGKSTLLLQASDNYVERGMQTYLMTAPGRDVSQAGSGSRPRPTPIPRPMTSTA